MALIFATEFEEVKCLMRLEAHEMTRTPTSQFVMVLDHLMFWETPILPGRFPCAAPTAPDPRFDTHR